MADKKCTFPFCTKIRWLNSDKCSIHAGAHKQWLHNIMSSSKTTVSKPPDEQDKNRKRKPSLEADTGSRPKIPHSTAVSGYSNNIGLPLSTNLDSQLGLMSSPFIGQHPSLVHQYLMAEQMNRQSAVPSQGQQNTGQSRVLHAAFLPKNASYLLSNLAHGHPLLASGPTPVASSNSMTSPLQQGARENLSEGDLSVFQLTPRHRGRTGGNGSGINSQLTLDNNATVNSFDNRTARSWHTPQALLQNTPVHQQSQQDSILQDQHQKSVENCATLHFSIQSEMDRKPFCESLGMGEQEVICLDDDDDDDVQLVKRKSPASAGSSSETCIGIQNSSSIAQSFVPGPSALSEIPAPANGIDSSDSDEDCIILDLSAGSQGDQQNGDNTFVESLVQTHTIDENQTVQTGTQETQSSSDSHSAEVDEPTGIMVVETVSLSAQADSSFSNDVSAKTFRQLSKESFYCCGCSESRCGFHTVLHTQLELHFQEVHPNETVYPCVHCGNVETRQDSLLQHLEKHLENQSKLFNCSVASCHFMSGRVIDVLNHMDIAHPECKSFSCWHCNAKFISFCKFCVHVKQNLLHIVKCKHCSAKDVNRRAIYTHLESSHPDKDHVVDVQDVLLCLERKKNKWNAFNKHSGEPKDVLQESNNNEDTTTPKPQSQKNVPKKPAKKKGTMKHTTEDGEEKQSKEHKDKSKELSDEKERNNQTAETGTKSPTSWINTTYLQEDLDQCDSEQSFRCVFCDTSSLSVDVHLRHIHDLHEAHFKGFACKRCDFVSLHWDAENGHRCAGSLSLRRRSRVGYDEEDAPLWSETVEFEGTCLISARTNVRKSKTEKTSSTSTENKSCSLDLSPEVTKMPVGSTFLHLLCNLCGMQCMSQSNMQTHIYSQHSDVMVCPVCSEKMGSDELFNQHLLEVHPDQYSNFEQVGSQHFISTVSCSDIEVEKERTVSGIDKDSSSDRISLAPENGVALDEISHQAEQSKSESPKSYTSDLLACKFCGFSSRVKSQMRSHLFTKHAEIMKCPKCDQRPNSDRRLRSHIFEVHTEEKLSLYLQCRSSNWFTVVANGAIGRVELKCQLCGYSYRNTSFLHDHLYTEHKEEMKCPQCPVQARNAEDFFNHLSEEHAHEKDRLFSECHFLNFVDVQPMTVKSSQSVSPQKTEQQASAIRILRTKKINTFSSVSKRHQKLKKKKISLQQTVKVKLQCKLCSFSEKTENEMIQHLFLTHPEVQCTACTTQVNDVEQLHIHISSNHPEEQTALFNRSAPTNWYEIYHSSATPAPRKLSSRKEDGDVRQWVSIPNENAPLVLKIGKQSLERTAAEQSSLGPADDSSEKMTSSMLSTPPPVNDSHLSQPPANSLHLLIDGETDVLCGQSTLSDPSQQVDSPPFFSCAGMSASMPAYSAEQMEHIISSTPEVREHLEYRCPHCTSDFRIRYKFYEHLCYHYHYRCFKCAYCPFLAFSGSSIVNHSKRSHDEQPCVEHLAKPNFEKRIEGVLQRSLVHISEPHTERRLKAYERVKLRKYQKALERQENRLHKSLKKRKVNTVQNNVQKKTVSPLKIKIDTRVQTQKGPSTTTKKSKLVTKSTPAVSTDCTEKSKWLICPYCRGPKKSQASIAREILYHIHYKPYECPVCEFTTSSEMVAKKHVATFHPEGDVEMKYTRIEKKEMRFQELMQRAVELSSLAVKTEITSNVKKKYKKNLAGGKSETTSKKLKGKKKVDQQTDVDPTLQIKCAHCDFVSTERTSVTIHLLTYHQDLLGVNSTATQQLEDTAAGMPSSPGQPRASTSSQNTFLPSPTPSATSSSTLQVQPFPDFSIVPLVPQSELQSQSQCPEHTDDRSHADLTHAEIKQEPVEPVDVICQ